MSQMHTEFTREEILEAFQAFDADDSGFVTAEELSSALACLGPDNFSQEEVEELITLADKDGDGHLNYTEFVEIFVGNLGKG